MKQKSFFKNELIKKKSSFTQPNPTKSLIYRAVHDISKLGEKSRESRQKDQKQQHVLQVAKRLPSREKSRDSQQRNKQPMHNTSKGDFNKLGSKGLLCDNFLKESSTQKFVVASRQVVSKNMFIYHYIIGKGGFGKVWKVESKKNRQHYALKEMLKSLVMTKKSIQSVMNERTLLADIRHPFIVNMHYSFQDRQTLFLVLDLMPGGDLRYHIGNKKHFSEIQSKFFIACIVLGLEYLHNNSIIHRDIKPENLVLDEKGYIRITDLGIARIFKPINSNDTSGTPGYMSPEVICRQNHSYVSDYFALGVIAYELMFGKRPYSGKSRKQIRDQILAKQVQAKKCDLPDSWSSQSLDFVNQLIQRKPNNRLGFGGIQQIKQHPWLRELNWKKLAAKQIESPFMPTMKKDNFDQDEQITIDDEEQIELIQKNALLLRKNEFQQLFKGYYFDEIREKSTQATQKQQQNLHSEQSVRRIQDNSKMPSKQYRRTSYSNSNSATKDIKSVGSSGKYTHLLDNKIGIASHNTSLNRQRK